MRTQSSRFNNYETQNPNLFRRTVFRAYLAVVTDCYQSDRRLCLSTLSAAEGWSRCVGPGA
jgi:hypothetical protein